MDPIPKVNTRKKEIKINNFLYLQAEEPASDAPSQGTGVFSKFQIKAGDSGQGKKVFDHLEPPPMDSQSLDKRG
jgi:hypothetical protein